MDVIDDTEEEAPPYFDPIAFAEKIGGLGDVLADMAIVYATDGHDPQVSADTRINVRRKVLQRAEERIDHLMRGVRSHYGFLYADEVRRKDALSELAKAVYDTLDAVRVDG